ncbi:MAG TPA: RluA family pseudouridine synthase [Verrucomicrobiae bacterium]|nr:RluA family pseudouridine synthase [Verrucomicrobiae bacterium]
MSLLVVSHEAAGQRLDQFLRCELPAHSRVFLQKLIKDRCVLVNGKPGKQGHPVRAGDEVLVEIPPTRPLQAQPEEIPLDILYEDADLIVINKPSGLVAHPAAGNREHTLVNALLHHCRGQLAGIGGVERPGIVHRLDKGTSGCIVVAKTDAAHQSLVTQFKSRAVKKIYRAVCRGKIERPSGRIETIIGRSEHDRKKMSSRVARGRPAITDYRVLKEGNGFTLVELTLHTGRTHQIRVHLAHIGHPIVGDTVYGRSRSSVSGHRSPFSVARPLLHAYKLGFTHPRSGEFMEFEAPLPADMEQIIGNI